MLRVKMKHFDDVFTRNVYNTIRQSIVDFDTIRANNNEDNFNLYYRYANFIDQNYVVSTPGATYSAMDKTLWKFNGYYQFTLGVEPYVTNRYDYWGYRICKATTHEFIVPAKQATSDFISEVKSLIYNISYWVGKIGFKLILHQNTLNVKRFFA